VGLVVQVDAVDLGILAVSVRRTCPVAGRHGAPPPGWCCDATTDPAFGRK